MRTAYLMTVLFFVTPFSVSNVSGQELFSLGKYVPADVHFYGNWRHTDARARLVVPYEEAFAKLLDSGIVQDVSEPRLLQPSHAPRLPIERLATRFGFASRYERVDYPG